MKVTDKQLRLIGSIVAAAGIVIAALTNSFNHKHPDDPNTYGVYLGIGIVCVGLIIQAPWIKEKNKPL